MTKEELIAAIKNYEPNSLVQVWCGCGDCRNPGGTYDVINVRGDVIPGRITLEIDYD